MKRLLFYSLAPAAALALMSPSHAAVVAWYQFEGNALDAVGPTFNNPSTAYLLNYVPGKVGSGLSPTYIPWTPLNGGYIEIPHTSDLANPRFTFEAWVRPDGIGPNNDQAGSVIIEKDRDESFWYGLAWRSNGKFLFATGQYGPGSPIYSVNSFPAGCFYHVVGTYDGTAFRLYVNGNLEAQRNSTTALDYSGPYPWAIGASPKDFGDIGWPRTWVGVIDEVKIYDNALSPTEVQTHYADGAPSTACGCPALWVSLNVYTPGVTPTGSFGFNTPCCDANFHYRLSFGNSGALPSLLPGAVAFLLPPNCTFVGQTFNGPTPPWVFVPPPATGPGVCSVIFNGPVPPQSQWMIDIEVSLDCDPTLPCDQQTVVLSEAVIAPFVGDCTIFDNIYDHRVTPCCSYDPNDCTVTPKGCGPEGLINSSQPLTYLVRFQNIGGGVAHLVTVRNEVDLDLDLNTLEILGSSHSNTLQKNGRVLTWTFPNIELASAHVDEPASHGHVEFRLRPRANAPAGTVITNSAEIVFDANDPITTISTTNTITLDPMPVAAFQVVPQAGSEGHTNDFHYTGGTAGASYRWYFGPNAEPQTSTLENPTGVVFRQPGPHLVSLRTRLGDCESEAAVRMVTAGRPSLSIARTAAGPVLSWAGDGYRIQETDDLRPPIQWRPASSLPISVGSWYFVQMPPPVGMRFYRLELAQ